MSAYPRFIAFEGGEGAGKTTQIRRLAEHLRAVGEDVVTTREPGGTPGAEEIRRLFVTGEPGRWTAKTDALLIAAARADHVARLIRPALDAGKTVLCDRFVHSTLAYQGQGLSPDMLGQLHHFATDDLWPDLVIWLDLPVEVGLQRVSARGAASAGGRIEERFERNELAFHERVREGFATLAASDGRIVRIDAMADVDSVEQAVRSAVGR